MRPLLYKHLPCAGTRKFYMTRISAIFVNIYKNKVHITKESIRNDL